MKDDTMTKKVTGKAQRISDFNVQESFHHEPPTSKAKKRNPEVVGKYRSFGFGRRGSFDLVVSR